MPNHPRRKTRRRPHKCRHLWKHLPLYAKILLPFSLLLVLAIGVLLFLTTPHSRPDPSEHKLPPKILTYHGTWVYPDPPANPYTAEDLTFTDGIPALTDGETTLGIDVSVHQGTIDWNAVAESGIDFAMVRIGYRGYVSGELHLDEKAIENLQGASDAGLKIGAYFFSQAITTEEAAEEAEMVLDFLKDFNLSMPVVYDWEFMNEDARTANIDSRTVTDCTRTFLTHVRDAGYEAMVYFSPSHAQSQIHLEELQDFDFWLAQYREQLDFPFAVDIWQYTSEGQFPGIEGNVDMNIILPRK